MIDQFHLLRPVWLISFAVLIAIIPLWKKFNTKSNWTKYLSPRLQEVLLEPNSTTTKNSLWLILLFLSIGTLGLSGPTWEKIPQPANQNIETTIIVLDLSLSMLSEDISPSRLERAKLKIMDILELRKEGYTALIAYAGDSHVVVPLTDDVNTIVNLLPSLKPQIMPVQGSNPNPAIKQAFSLLKNTETAQGLIILITDGVENAIDITQHKDPNFPISILSLGTEKGGVIPIKNKSNKEILRNAAGAPVITKVPLDVLDDIAIDTFGRHQNAGITTDDIKKLLDTPLPEGLTIKKLETKTDEWNDLGFWACLIMLPLLLLLFKRNILFSLFILLAVTPSTEASWKNLWERPDQRGFKSLTKGNPTEAANLFVDPTWKAAAHYLSGDYLEAEQTFLQDDSPTGHYNRGNALAKQGKLKEAIKAYKKTLSENRNHKDAQFNKNLLEYILTRNEEAETKAEQEDGSGEKSLYSSKTGSNQTSIEANSPDSGGKENPEQNLEITESELITSDLASEQEENDAFEQWMRRIPNDPGGLLRRKFQHETNQRLRQGDYSHNQTRNQW